MTKPSEVRPPPYFFYVITGGPFLNLLEHCHHTIIPNATCRYWTLKFYFVLYFFVFCLHFMPNVYDLLVVAMLWINGCYSGNYSPCYVVKLGIFRRHDLWITESKKKNNNNNNNNNRNFGKTLRTPSCMGWAGRFWKHAGFQMQFRIGAGYFKHSWSNERSRDQK